jgi:uncharacterized protein (TIGR03435 family)
MRRFACVVAIVAQVSPNLAAQSLEFDVASIKKNTTNRFATGPPPNPSTGRVSMVNVPIRNIVLQAYPVQVLPAIGVLGLPSWADSERYDVIAKGKPGATLDERQQMWRALLADRMKLAAHYEMRELPSWDLVFARSDHRLGPQLKPSSLDCSQSAGVPPPPEAAKDLRDMRQMAMSRCSVFWFDLDETMSSGGARMSDLIRMMSPAAGRPIVDRTGLEGFYSVAFRFQRIVRLNITPSPDDPPSVFTAIKELGLKLESSKTQAQVLVLDHIERPTED